MDTNYLPVAANLSLSNGNTKRWIFRPQTLLIDDGTKYVVGMCLEYDDGTYCNLLLHEASVSEHDFLRYAGNLLATAGAKLVAGQIRTGNIVVDNICSAVVGRQLKSEFKNLIEIALQSRSSYFAIDNGELVIKKPISVYDLEGVN